MSPVIQSDSSAANQPALSVAVVEDEASNASNDADDGQSTHGEVEHRGHHSQVFLHPGMVRWRFSPCNHCNTD